MAKSHIVTNATAFRGRVHTDTAAVVFRYVGHATLHGYLVSKYVLAYIRQEFRL